MHACMGPANLRVAVPRRNERWRRRVAGCLSTLEGGREEGEYFLIA